MPMSQLTELTDAAEKIPASHSAPAALVTGASTGIGLAIAQELVAAGWVVFAGVRRTDDVDRLRQDLGPRCRPLLLDVTDGAAIHAAASTVSAALGSSRLAALINNAGIAVGGPLASLPPDDLRRQLEVNVVGVLAVTQAFLPLLGSDPQRSGPPGRVVNISSVSGRIAYPFLGPYAASKHALEALSDSLRRELLIWGIDVIVVQPGSVATPIWEKAAQRRGNPATPPIYRPALAKLAAQLDETARRAMPPTRVARVVRRSLETPRPRSRYPLPDRALTGWWLPRLLPDRWLDRVLARALDLTPDRSSD